MNNDNAIKSHSKKNKIVYRFKTSIIWLQKAVKRTFTGHSKSTWLWIFLFMIITIISIFILIIQNQDETWLFDKVIRFFVIPIIELDAWGWLLFIIFMGIQGILVPIPSELVLLTTGLVWGILEGSLLGIIGSMAAGILTYYIAVLGGRPMVERFLGQENLDAIDTYIERYGAGVILIARAFPFMAFDPISYASGFLKIRFRTYVFATLLGSIIRCIFYAWLGSTMNPGDLRDMIDDPVALQSFINAGSSQFNAMFLMIVIFLGSAYLIYQFVLLPYLKNKTLANNHN